MNALIIENKTPKAKRILRASIGIYLTLFCGYFLFTEATINGYGVFFFTTTIGVLLGLILLLGNTLWTSNKKLLTIDNSKITSNILGSKFNEDWVSVSKTTIGISYIIFFVDGGRKQRKLDLSHLLYSDVGIVKSKVIELCEYKNISYIKD